MVITTPHRSIDRYAIAGSVGARPFRVSRFDRVTSMLTATMILIGVLVALLFLAWCFLPTPLLDQVHVPPRTVAGSPVQSVTNSEFLLPESIEVVDLAEPSIQQSIAAVTQASSVLAAAELSSIADAGSVDSSGQPNSVGDLAAAGPPGNADEVPRFKRWQLEFQAADLKTYAQQLDHFGITLGIVQPTRTQLMTGMSTSSPMVFDRQVGAASQLYFAWARPSPLEQFDRQLFRAAGVASVGGQMVKFIPASLEDQLAVLELAHATAKGHPSTSEIAKTVFNATKNGADFEFVVAYQRYRNPKP